MSMKPENRPSPTVVLYSLAFRALRRIALPGDARRRTTSDGAAPGHRPRRTLCPAEKVVLERAPGATGSEACRSLCLPDDVQ
jgi:hypothetical protein